MRKSTGVLFLAGGVIAGVAALLLTSKSDAAPSQGPGATPTHPSGLNELQTSAKTGDLVLVNVARLMALRTPPGSPTLPAPSGFPEILTVRVDSADAAQINGHTEDKELGINPLTQSPLSVPMINVPRSAIDGIVS